MMRWLFSRTGKMTARRLLLAPLLCLLAWPALAQVTGNTDYHLSAGDVIRVHVMGQEDLSVEVPVSDTGDIIYPLLGELKVEGLTREETERLVYQKLKPDYLVEPVVSVTIVKYRQIFLQGEVKLAGPYAYTPGLSLRRAILDAGGFTDLANKDKIYVVNESEPQGKERRVDMDYQLQPGDIITIKASFF
ncbi:MAG: polysaccharide export protein [Halioglobus sp.]|nr:polysaccharide export protein [Halioglobus sp.]